LGRGNEYLRDRNVNGDSLVCAVQCYVDGRELVDVAEVQTGRNDEFLGLEAFADIRATALSPWRRAYRWV
jgi:hypothetical protein